MAYKDYLERIKKRDLNLWNYHLKHPGITQEKLAKIFKINQARVSRILKRHRENGNEIEDRKNNIY